MIDSEYRQRLEAILAADAAGYARLMAIDERATVAALDDARRVFRQQIEAQHGRVIDMAGDSVLAVFETAVGAVSAALAAQHDLQAAQSSLPDERRLRFRIGVHLGDVIEKADGTVYGDGVNIAARLQALAQPGGITVSDAVQGAVRGKVAATFVDQGEQPVKNLPHAVRTFGVHAGGSGTAPATAADTPAPQPPADRPSLAVLPFTNMSGDPEQDYFADGMVEDIITALARTRLFFVIARNSTFVYKGKAVDIKRVGRELGVRYVLEGGVRKSGNRVRITGQLIEVESGHHVWADRFEGQLEDVFDLQDRITAAIVSAIEPNVRRAEIERIRTKPPSNLQAYELVLRALPGLMPRSDRAGLDQALASIRRAVEIDPHYPVAHAMGAMACMVRIAAGYGDASDVKAGLRFADDALSERDDDPTTLAYAGAAIAVLGYRAMGFRVLGFRYDEGLRATERALSLSPNLLMVQHSAGQVRGVLGEGDAALSHFEQAIRISPFDPAMSAFVASAAAAHALAGHYEQALQGAQRAVQDGPNFVFSHRVLVLTLGLLGRLDEAKIAAQRMLELAPEFTVSRYQSISPFKDSEFRERCAAIYRAAGVPK